MGITIPTLYIRKRNQGGSTIPNYEFQIRWSKQDRKHHFSNSLSIWLDLALEKWCLRAGISSSLSEKEAWGCAESERGCAESERRGGWERGRRWRLRSVPLLSGPWRFHGNNRNQNRLSHPQKHGGRRGRARAATTAVPYWGQQVGWLRASRISTGWTFPEATALPFLAKYRQDVKWQGTPG